MTNTILKKRNGSFLIFFLLLAMGGFVFFDYLILQKVFVFSGFASDTIRKFFADYYFVSERFFSGDLSFWSFRYDLGMNVYPLLSKWNPFDLLIILAGKHHLPGTIGYAVFLRIIVAGFLFFKFLQKIHISTNAALIGSIAFSYCGYMTLNGHWYHYLDYAVYASLMLLLFERWFQEGKWLLFVLAMGFANIKGILQVYQFFFFLSIYGLFRWFFEYGFDLKRIPAFLGRFVALYGLGFALGSVYLFPELYQTMSSARGGESIHKFTLIQWIKDVLTVSDPPSIKTFLLRYLSNDLIGSFERFRGAGNYLEAPSAYPGLIILFSAPLLFFHGNNRHKTAFMLLIGCCVTYFLFPYVRVVGNAFASGTYKHTIMYNTIFLVITASYSLNGLMNDQINPAHLFLSFSFFSGVLILGWATKDTGLDPQVFRLIVLFFLLYAILFTVMQFPKWSGHVKYVLITVVIVELSLFARITVSRSSGILYSGFMERGESYFEKETLEAVSFLHSYDSTFYRVEKGYYSDYLNDAVVQGYFGTSAYHGFSAPAVVDFHRSMRISPRSPRIASYRYGLSKRHRLQSLLSVKYYLSKSMEDKPLGFDHLRTFGSVHVFENRSQNSMGSIYRQYIRRVDFEPLPIELKEKVILKYAVSDEDIQGFPCADPSTPEVEKDEALLFAQSSESFSLSSFHEDHILGMIHLETEGILFFPIPFDKGWKASIDGKNVIPLKINLAFIGLPVPKGTHRIELKFIPPYLYFGGALSLLCMALIVFLYVKFPKIYAQNTIDRISFIK